MPDEFVPESTKYFGASMRHVSRRDREKVHGAAVLAVMARTVRHILAYPFRVSVDLLLIFAGSMLGLVGPIFYSQMFMDNVLLHNSVDSA
ncbi:MAG: hypothetical protein NTW86_11625, partial [Candidatus Sumerlaeota bacterium]|nr:hypothetical protein [Candidatus Sumerlaeota bacterium]